MSKDKPLHEEDADEAKAVVNEDQGIKEVGSKTDTTEDVGHVDVKLPKQLGPEKKTFVTRIVMVWFWLVDHKKFSLPLLAAVFLGVIAAVPFTRYAVAGLVLKKDYHVTVLDSQNSKPVSSATVTVGGKKVTTDKDGKATIKVAVGSRSIMATKKYYKTASLKTVVPILRQKDTPVIKLTATGRPIQIQVKNVITGKAVANVKVNAAGTEVKTDKDGKAEIVLPAGKSTQEAVLSAEGYNEATVNVQVSGQTFVEANNFKLTPAGKLYFLSNKTGSLDVVKTNLDGTDRKTVLQGTGNEVKNQTSLLASKDWKYLALLSKRDGGKFPKIFLIDTSNDKVTTVDEGTANFGFIGWSGHRFVYNVDRDNIPYGQANRAALKSFNAESGQLTTLDQNQSTVAGGSGYVQFFTGTSILDDKLVYGIGWSSFGYTGNNTFPAPVLREIQLSGQGKKDVKTFAGGVYGYLNVEKYEPGSLYITYNSDDKATKYEYEDGTLSELKNPPTQQEYFTFLESPSAGNVIWSESRDGKQTVFLGDKDGKFPKQILSGTYQTYGWYSDDYVLVSKDSSELYIESRDGSTPLKVTDYYKPDYSYQGYGGGYGGL